MMIVPINWSFQRKSILPIIDATGECEIKEGEPLLIQNAIEVLEKAEKFKGKPYSNKPIHQSSKLLSISLSIIFPTETDIQNYMGFLQKSK